MRAPGSEGSSTRRDPAVTRNPSVSWVRQPDDALIFAGGIRAPHPAIGGFVVALWRATPRALVLRSRSVPKISSGGGVVASATFSASATLGQPVAGMAAGTHAAVVLDSRPASRERRDARHVRRLVSHSFLALLRSVPNKNIIVLDVASSPTTTECSTPWATDPSLIDANLNRGATTAVDGDGCTVRWTAGVYFCQSGVALQVRRDASRWSGRPQPTARCS